MNREVTSEWRCSRCRLLLGSNGPRRFEFAYKAIRYVFHGKGIFTTKCRRCGALNDVKVG